MFESLINEEFVSRLCETVGDFNTVGRLRHSFEALQVSQCSEDYKSFAGFSSSSKVPAHGSNPSIIPSLRLTNAQEETPTIQGCLKSLPLESGSFSVLLPQLSIFENGM